MIIFNHYVTLWVETLGGYRMDFNNKLNYPEAADLLHYSQAYLRKLVCERRIPFYKMAGGRVYFDRGELETWIDSKMVHFETVG